MVYYICIPKNLETFVSRFLLEAPTRFELVIEVLQTFALPLGYGTIIRNGAVDGARTRDLHLGKVALYQLSYYRITTRLHGAKEICAGEETRTLTP